MLVGLVIATTVGGSALSSDRSSVEAARFTGDFEVAPPGWQQYTGLQYEEDRPLDESFQLVGDPVRQGTKAARYEVRQGYSRFGHNEDVSAVWTSNEQPGDEYWYAWSTLFPTGWVAPEGWGIFAEWHSPFGTSPIIAFDARADTASLNVHAGLTDVAANSFGVNRTFPLLTTLSKGRWNDFVLHVRWTTSSSGLIEVYHRVAGESTLKRIAYIAATPTLQFTSDGGGGTVYVLFGLYRRSYCPQPTELDCVSARGQQPDSVLYHDGFTRAQTYEEAAKGAFPGPVPKLVIPEPPQPRPAKALTIRSRARIVAQQVDERCKKCTVVVAGANVTATITGGRDDRDTAVALFNVVAPGGTLVIRSRVTIAPADLGGNLVFINIRDERGRTVAEVFRSDPDGRLSLWIPSSRTRRDPTRIDTPVRISPGSPKNVELRLAGGSISLVVGGRFQAQVTGLGPVGALRVRTGIDHYDTSTVETPVVVRLERLTVGSTAR